MSGYAFVPLPPRVNRRGRPEARLDRRVANSFTGRLEIEVRCEQPLHVGSGFKALLQVEGRRAVVRCGARVGGGLGVPGSSLKGAVRSRYEAITRSCVPGGAPRRGERVSRRYGKVDVRLAQTVEHLDVFARGGGGCKPTAMCPACALFGRMSQGSRVMVEDLRQDEARLVIAPMPPQFGPRLHHLGDYRQTGRDQRGARLELTSLHGRKFAVSGEPLPDGPMQHVEAIPQGAVLRGVIRLRNVTPPELGGLLAALGVRPESRLKLGAGKGYGFGRVRVAIRAVELVGADGARRTADDPGWRAAFEGWEDRFAEGEDALVRIHGAAC